MIIIYTDKICSQNVQSRQNLIGEKHTCNWLMLWFLHLIHYNGVKYFIHNIAKIYTGHITNKQRCSFPLISPRAINMLVCIISSPYARWRPFYMLIRLIKSLVNERYKRERYHTTKAPCHTSSCRHVMA